MQIIEFKKCVKSFNRHFFIEDIEVINTYRKSAQYQSVSEKWKPSQKEKSLFRMHIIYIYAHYDVYMYIYIIYICITLARMWRSRTFVPCW